MTQFITNKSIFNTHTFEIVDKIPEGYFVWNITLQDENKDYIPLAELLNGKGFDVNPDTLKAIKISNQIDRKYLMQGASYGVNNLTKCRKIANSKRTFKTNMAKNKKAFADYLLPLFQELTA